MIDLSKWDEYTSEQKKRSIPWIVFVAVVFCIAIIQMIEGQIEEKSKGEEDMAGYKLITMEDAKQIFETEGDYIILDVRRADEFASGHIPRAINVANEDITDVEPQQLPDKDQYIYVYCRSGNRSKQAAAKLAAMGYKNIIEVGGIMDWTGDMEK